MVDKDFDYYINLPYTTLTKLDRSDPNKPAWFASVKELSGCMTEADLRTEIHEMIHDGWLDLSSFAKGFTDPRAATSCSV